jgi:hypothetical protein
MYLSTYNFRRTPEEKSDPFLSWKRSDQAFFAGGACHILAFLFVHLHPNEGYKIIHTKPIKNYSGNHVYVTDGTWAFDHNGWTLEKELLEVTKKDYTRGKKDWDFERIVIKEDLETFCKKYNSRPPAYYAYLPWERAYNYIKKFPSHPPKKHARSI